MQAALPESVVVVGGVALILACGLAAASVILGVGLPVSPTHRRRLAILEREKDIAAALGWSWRGWWLVRIVAVALALAIGIASGIWLVAALLAFAGIAGVRFAVAGRAARRRLRLERAFLDQMRVLRDRMAIGNQSLDTALQEIGRNPGKELAGVLRPLARGGSIVENIVECGVRSRSPIIENACGLLIWARTRSLDALISIVDDVLLPVGEAQLAVAEESLVTLTQQRAVAFAMAALMTLMFVAIVRVDAFRSYYRSVPGSVVLLIAVGMFAVLVASVGRIVGTTRWTRWDLRELASQERRPHE
jgi:hypothetical protein